MFLMMVVLITMMMFSGDGGRKEKKSGCSERVWQAKVEPPRQRPSYGLERPVQKHERFATTQRSAGQQPNQLAGAPVERRLNSPRLTEMESIMRNVGIAQGNVAEGILSAKRGTECSDHWHQLHRQPPQRPKLQPF